MISVHDLHKRFDTVEVLKGVTFEVGKGEVLALVGKSGEGKSVVLKHVAGLMQPDGGSVLIDGDDMCYLNPKRLARLRSRFGFLFQGGALFDSLTVYDNVSFPLREKTTLPEGEIRERVLTVLDEVGMRGDEHKYPAELSGGMVKRAALARSLVREPEIMLFDEPTTGLDPVTARSILQLIASCRQRFPFTGIVVTHQIPDIFSVVDKVALLHGGRILALETPERIRVSEDPVVCEFITGGGER